jgi:hypothetical protein
MIARLKKRFMPEKEESTVGAGFTESELEFASFWVRNRVKIHQATIGILIAINVGCWGYSLWGVIDAYAISYPVESRIMQDIADNAFIAQSLESNRPKSIQASAVQMFEGTNGRYDMVVPIQNPNEQWYAEFTYRFNIGGEETPKKSGFVLPKQSSFLGEFGYAPKTKGGRVATLAVEGIRWRRIDPGIVGADYSAWASARDAFDIKNVSFIPAEGSAGSPRTSFTFHNPTGYGYWSLGLYVFLLRGESPVASTYLSLSSVKPDESRNVNIDWFGNINGVTNTKVVPIVNFLDSSVYLPSTKF